MRVNVVVTLYINTKHIPLLVEFKKRAAAEFNGIMVMKLERQDRIPFISMCHDNIVQIHSKAPKF